VLRLLSMRDWRCGAVFLDPASVAWFVDDPNRIVSSKPNHGRCGNRIDYKALPRSPSAVNETARGAWINALEMIVFHAQLFQRPAPPTPRTGDPESCRCRRRIGLFPPIDPPHRPRPASKGLELDSSLTATAASRFGAAGAFADGQTPMDRFLDHASGERFSLGVRQFLLSAQCRTIPGSTISSSHFARARQPPPIAPRASALGRTSACSGRARGRELWPARPPRGCFPVLYPGRLHVQRASAGSTWGGDAS